MQGNCFLRVLMPGILAAGLLSASGFAQTTSATVSDAQIEANVLKALVSVPGLANQPIKSTTVYGTVTLTGTVRDEASRDMAEKVVSEAPDVKKVVDEMTIGAVTENGAQGAQQTPIAAQQGSNPALQSDGTMAQAPPPPDQVSNTAGAYPPPPAGAYPPPPAGAYPPPPPGAYPPSQPGYGQVYGQAPARPYVEQKGGDAVTVPNGTLLRVRVNQQMDSKHTVPGTTFDGVMLNDVIAGGSVAIPRGAAIQGKVVDVHKAGDFKGRGALTLQLTTMTLGGRLIR